MIDALKFRHHLILSEGRRKFPYEDTVGKTSIAVGRNLDDVGLSDDEIDLMLNNDMQRAIADAGTLPYYENLDEVRQMVICDLVFNMGLTRFRDGFIRTNQALIEGDYERAADELVDSKWYRQVGVRGRRNVAMMRTGEYA